MVATTRFFITDVFGEEKYSGNPLATFIDSDGIGAAEMQKIAREINFSETTFITSRGVRDVYDVRIFTPTAEVEFAGHPTLGTAFVIREAIVRAPVERVVLNLLAGRVPVDFQPDGLLWMRQAEPRFGKTLDPAVLADVLGLDVTEIDSAWPIVELSTGFPHIIVPLKTQAALKRARVHKERYFSLVADAWAKLLLVFAPEAYTATQALAVRVFADYYGIAEDAATGSGNGCLAAYLARHRYFADAKVNITVGQGYEMQRPSTLALFAVDRGDGITVKVGGRVIRVAEGQWG
jgi:trans-2,3-dihydro-3-hydroxyanthranilate isomerase